MNLRQVPDAIYPQLESSALLEKKLQERFKTLSETSTAIHLPLSINQRQEFAIVAHFGLKIREYRQWEPHELFYISAELGTLYFQFYSHANGLMHRASWGAYSNQTNLLTLPHLKPFLPNTLILLIHWL